MEGDISWALSRTQVAVEIVATVAFALSGVIEGARKRLDAVGICVVAGLAAFGGGTVRDVLLDRRPLFWVQHEGWVMVGSHAAQWPQWASLLAAAGTAAALRAAAIVFDWRLPAWQAGAARRGGAGEP